MVGLQTHKSQKRAHAVPFVPFEIPSRRLAGEANEGLPQCSVSGIANEANDFGLASHKRRTRLTLDGLTLAENFMRETLDRLAWKAPRLTSKGDKRYVLVFATENRLLRFLHVVLSWERGARERRMRTRRQMSPRGKEQIPAMWRDLRTVQKDSRRGTHGQTGRGHILYQLRERTQKIARKR